ncbi:MAG: NAD-dependent epimerase/dehydratase family protein [Bacillota bacterium]
MILVTGATGHIGNVLVNKLMKMGEELRLLLPPGESVAPLNGIKAEIVVCDIRNSDAVRQAVEGCDTVFHLAGIVRISKKNDALLEGVNIGGTQNMVDACLHHKVKRLIYISSVHAIKEPADGTAITERHSFVSDAKAGGYANSKAEATRIVQEGIARGLDAVILFPSGVIGPFDYKLSEIGCLIKRFIKGAKSKVAFYFDGAYDFVDVRDVCDALIKAWKMGRPGEGYIISGEQASVKQIYTHLLDIQGRRKKLVRVPLWLVKFAAALMPAYYRIFRKKPVFTRYAVEVLSSNAKISSAKAQKELGYRARSVRESLRDSVAWFDREKARHRAGKSSAKKQNNG